MLIPIHFSWHRDLQPLGWSIGYCSFCKQECAVRLQTINETFRLYGIPLSNKFKGISGRCDFCQRNVATIRDPYGVSFTNWRPSDGLTALFEKLRISPSAHIPESVTDERLQSFLKSVQKVSSSVDLGVFGVVLGAFVGVLVAVPLGLLLHDNDIAKLSPDRHGVLLLSIIIGILAGATLGAAVQLVVGRKRKAIAMIESTCANYKLDVHRLEEISRSFKGRVRWAVKVVCEKHSGVVC
jgi:hypothetical protein